MLIKLLKIWFGISDERPKLPKEYSYIGEDGCYYCKPKGWKIGCKMYSNYNVVGIDTKSLRQYLETEEGRRKNGGRV